MTPGNTVQNNTTIFLKPFEPRAAQAEFSCSVQLREKSRMLLLRYSVRGPLEQLVLPATEDNAGFKADLWRATCMECFLRSGQGSAYIEWNFSPAGTWWVCAFDSYRVPAVRQPDNVRPSHIQTHQTTGHFELRAAIPVLDNDILHIDPALILEHQDGQRSHWARAHPDGKPDFHRLLSRTVSL